MKFRARSGRWSAFLTKRSKLPQLLAGVLLLGIADSIIGPYLVLFGADEASLSPLQVGIFMSLIAVSGLAVSSWLSRRYDRSASRWPALVAVAGPAIGYLALTATTSYAVLMLIGVGLLGAGMAAFPQLFTLARTHLDQTDGGTAGRGTAALRSVWSLAWAIGPMIGAAVLSRQGYDGLMMLTAFAFALVAVPLLLLGTTPVPLRPPQPETGQGYATRPMLLVAASFTFFHTAMLSGSVALPLYVTRTMARPDSDVGLLFSICALVEIPAALSMTFLSARARKGRWIAAGMLLLGAYFLLAAISSSMALLIATQFARGVSLAVVGALGITYMQDLLPHAIGRATTMFANTLTIGSLISGVLAGVTAQALGYRAALLLCGLLATVGCVLFVAARRNPPSVPSSGDLPRRQMEPASAPRHHGRHRPVSRLSMPSGSNG